MNATFAICISLGQRYPKRDRWDLNGGLGFGASRVNSIKTKPVRGNPVKVLARIPRGSKDEKHLRLVLRGNTRITSDKFSYIDPELVDSTKNISSDFVL